MLTLSLLEHYWLRYRAGCLDWRPDRRSANENARNKLFMSGGPMITSGLRASVFVLAVQIYLSILQVNFLYNFVDCIVK